MEMSVLFLFLIIFLNGNVNGYLRLNNHAFDLELYEDVLDPVLCQEQLDYLRFNDTPLLAQFMDAGIRTPKGIFLGNFNDLGNYYQCLDINQEIPNSVVEGKYCSIHIPLDLWNIIPVISTSRPWNGESIPLDDNTLNSIRMLDKLKHQINMKEISVERSGGSLDGLYFNLAICLPKVCTTKEAINGIFPLTDMLELEFEDNFCRLPNDKPRVGADYVAIVIFSIIGLLTILCTGYDVHHTVIRKRDPKQANKLYLTFSFYTNTRRLVTYTPVPGTLECMDGIRVLAMMWVIMGHTFVYQLNDFLANPLTTYEWIVSWQSLWVTTSPITVDTFFTLSGMLVVYTTAGKLTGKKLLKNIHLFYLNRLLRMFPILATFVLLKASFLNRVTDGPNLNMVASGVHNCRVFWWSTLLHIQNYVNPENMCLGHTWYLAVDVQLYIVSPIVLFWMLSGRKLYSWTVLITVFTCAMISTSIYNTLMQFASAPVSLSRDDDEQRFYMYYYYLNTLTRSPPFFVGMIFGYLLHLNRDEKVVLPKIQVGILWICAFGIMSLVIYSTYPIIQADWNNQTADTLINCLIRPGWAVALGWLVFACHYGYGGPINWILSLQMWKVPSRLSYAMYIVHFPMLFVRISTAVTSQYFTVEFSMLKFMNDLGLAVIVSFLAVVLIDAPCSLLIKQFMGGGIKRQLPKDETKRSSNDSYNSASLKHESKTAM